VSWVNRISNLFRRNQVDEELEEELQFHLDARTRDNLSAGMNAAAAQHDARRRFGNTTLAKERAHEMNIVVSIETIGRDLRYALRGLRKSPGFTVVAILTLALGIGANTAVFSVVDAALLRPLPYRNADRLVMIAQRLPKEPVPVFDTYREFEEWDRSSNSFETMAAATWAGRLQSILSWHGEKKEVVAVPVSVNFFSMLGVGAARGRTFAAKDLTSACSVVLAYPFWQQRLGSTPDWIGKSLTLDDRACTVVGVMPKAFSFYPKQTELWTLITPGSQFAQKPWDMPVLAFGLLKPGVSRSAAQAELASIQNRIITENPTWAAMKLEPAHGAESSPRSVYPFCDRWLRPADRLCERGESPGRTRYRAPEGTRSSRSAWGGAVSSHSTATDRERSAFASWSRPRRLSRDPLRPVYRHKRGDAAAPW
jgi:MacB-like periplasmic core domain